MKTIHYFTVSMMMFLLAMGFALPGNTFSTANAQTPDSRLIREKDVDNDGEVELVLENRFLQLVVKPSLGGIGKSLVYKKTGDQMLASTAMEAGGLFQDCVWQQGQRGDWFNASYAYQILANTPEKASVKLWRRGTTDSLSWITITKTLTIYRDECLLQVGYEYANQMDSMTPLTYGFWVHNNLAVEKQENTYFLPTTNGVLARRLGRTGAEEDWIYNVSRGWTAMLGEKGSGLAIGLDYRYLMCLYNYYSSDLKTVEWMLRSQKINNGEALKTRLTIIPFSGLQSVDGVEGDVVGSIETPEKPAVDAPLSLVVRIASPQRRTLNLRVVRRLLPGAEWTEVTNTSLECNADETKEVRASFQPGASGTHVVKVILDQNGKPAGDFEKPVVIGQASGKYNLPPREERIGNPEEKFGKVINPGEYRKDITLSDAIVTPHVRWAKPYYLGKTRALFIIPHISQRDIIELAQRMSLEFDRVTIGAEGYSTSGDLAPPNFKNRDANENLRGLLKTKPYDVIVIAVAQWQTWLEEDIRKMILERVQKGAGLVWVTPADLPDDLWKLMPVGKPDTHARPNGQWRKDKDHYLTAGLPFDAMPRTSFQPFTAPVQGEALASVGSEHFGYRPLITVGNYQQGRVVCLTYNGPDNSPAGCALTPNITPYRMPRTYAFKEYNDDFCTFNFWEYAYSLMIKSILWSCGKEPELVLENITVVPAASLPADKVSAPTSVALTLRNDREPADFRLHLTVRDAFSQVEGQVAKVVRVGSGKQSVSLDLPAPLSGGLHFAEVIIYNGGFVVNWGTASFEIPRQASIESVELDHPLYVSRDSTANITVGLKGTGKATIAVTLVDARQREVSQFTSSVEDIAGTREIVVPVKLDKVATQSARARVEVFVDGRRQDRKDKRLLITQPRAWDDFRYTMNMYPANFHYSPQFMERVREDGITDCQTGLGYYGLAAMVDADFNMRGSELMPFFHFHHSAARAQLYQEIKANYQKTHDKKYLIRDPCVNNPDFREATRQTARRVATHFSRYGGYDYCLTDELSLTAYGDAFDFCFCQYCLQAFRAWSKGVYGTIEALNKEWDTKFASFDEVMPMTYDEAKDRPNPAPWADHRSFMEYTMHDFVRLVKDEVHKIDPKAGISLSGTQAPQAYGGDDVWLRTQVYDGLHQYGHAGQYRMHPSFKRSLRISPWGGYGSHGPIIENIQWDNVFNGASGMSFWFAPLCWNPDFTLSQCGRDYKAATQPLREGIGKLLMNLNFEDYGIGLHYSQPSIHASFFNRVGSLFADDREGWMSLLNDLGLQYSFVAYKQIEAGELAKHPYRVLILPYSLALSPKEVAEIRQFVERGGLLIADAQAGLMDDHCKPQAAGQLDDLFGIRRADLKALPAEGELKVGVDDDGLGIAGKNIPAVVQESSIVLAGGKALSTSAKAPAIIIHKAGKGTAIYLNFLMSQYGNLRGLGKQNEQPIKDLIGATLQKSGIRPVAEVTETSPPSAGPKLACQVFGFCQGVTEYVGLLPGIPKTAPECNWPVRLSFGKKAFVYDVRAGKALGSCAQAEVTLKAGQPKLYALLPYQVLGITLQAPKNAVAGSSVTVKAKLKISDGKAGLHVVRLEVVEPGSTLRHEYCSNLLSPNGVFSASVDFALNDPPGIWQFNVRDVASGVTASVPITLTAGAQLPKGQIGNKESADKNPETQLLWKRAERPSRSTWLPVATAAPVSSNEPNLLQNPTLLIDENKDGLPDGWAEGGEKEHGKITMTSDSAVTFHGSPTVKFTVGPSESPKRWDLVQNLTPLLQQYKGKSLTFTVRFFRDKPRKEGHYDCDLRIRQWSKEGKFIGDVVTLYVPIKVGLWQTFAGTGMVSPETVSMELLFEGTDYLGESFWFSSFQLQPATAT